MYAHCDFVAPSSYSVLHIIDNRIVSLDLVGMCMMALLENMIECFLDMTLSSAFSVLVSSSGRA